MKKKKESKHPLAFTLFDYRKQNRKNKHSLTLSLFAVLFVSFLIALALSAVLMFVFVRTGIIKSVDGRIDYADAIWLMALMSTALGSLFILLFARLFVIPINKLVFQMNQLYRGNFKARLHFAHNGSYVAAFNEMSKSFNALAEELESTEMLRSDFINNFSHEFKTPIVSIAGFAKLLKKGNLTKEQQMQYLDAIEEESLRLTYMATNVLNLTKVENQSILSGVTRYNISEQIRACFLILEPKWTKKELEPELGFEEFEILANEELMKQVWINLIDNAIKFSPDGKTVNIAAFLANNQLRVDVSNEGEPIPEEKQKKIFNKFYQSDESHSTEGNGIGLAIVKRIVELHKGSVCVKCQNGNVTFSVELPQARRI